MISAIYKNRLWYYNLLNDFLEHKIKAFPFTRKFMHQRSDDLIEDQKINFSSYYITKQWNDNEMKFREKYLDKLYAYPITEDVTKILNEYVEGAKKYGIKGELFFEGVYDDLFVNIRDFYPRDRKEAEIAGWDDSWDEFGFPELTPEEYEEEYSIDETELRKKVQEKFNILKENKEMWM